jgi:hypothetical protein
MMCQTNQVLSLKVGINTLVKIMTFFYLWCRSGAILIRNLSRITSV